MFKSKAKSEVEDNERFLHFWLCSHRWIFPKVYQKIDAVKRL